MKRIVILFIFIFAVVSPSASYAENILTMEELSIQVMPEFAYHPNDQKKDHAPLLFGYQGSMVNNSEQPQRGQIEIPLPVKEKNFRIGYVADYSSDLKKVYEIEYTVDLERGTISWTTSEEIQPQERYKFVIEFYTDGLKVDGSKKSLAYQFKSFADIGLVNLAFTKPEKAKNWKLSPAPEEKSHADGKNLFGYQLQEVKAGEVKNFKLTYERKETKPTIELMNLPEEKNVETGNYFAVGAFGGVSLLSVGAITILLRNKKRKQ